MSIPFEQSELLRLALEGLDKQIAELQEKRAQLATLVEPRTASSSVKTTKPTSQGGKMSDEARAKISAAAKKRWAKVRKAKVEAAKTAAAKKAPAKKTPVKAQAASTKGKKTPPKKGKATALAVEAATEKVAS